MKKEKIIKYVLLALTIAINIFIIANGFVAGAKSGQMSTGAARIAADVINDIEPNTITEESFPSFASFFRKFAGHFCLFGLSGILTTLTSYFFCKNTRFNSHLWVILFSSIIGFLVALISELAQKITLDRVASFKDVGIDYSGYLIALFLSIIILLIGKAKIFKKKQAN